VSARDELAAIIESVDSAAGWDVSPDSYAMYAAAIRAAGYSKRETITTWGVAFVHNGAFFKEYHSKEAAQAFANEMNEVGAHLVVVSREHIPAAYGEWATA